MHIVIEICSREGRNHLIVSYYEIMIMTNCAIPKLLNHCQLELLNFVILLYLSVYIIMIRPGAVAH